MRIDIIRRMAQKVRYNATVEWYNFWYIVLGKRQRVVPQVASIDETIRRIAQEGCSISRFGDGELLLTSPDKAIGFQQGSPRLAAMLREVLVEPRRRASGVPLGHVYQSVPLQPQVPPLLAHALLLVRRVVGSLPDTGTEVLQYLRDEALAWISPRKRIRADGSKICAASGTTATW